MTSKERMARAMRLELPDRVPVMCQMSIGHMLLRTGLSPVEFWLSKDCFAEGLLSLRKEYDFDGILVSLHGHSPAWERNIARIHHEEKRDVVVWKGGGRTIFPFDDLPQPDREAMAAPPSISEFDPKDVPERLDFIPVSQGLEFAIDPDHKHDIFEVIRAEAGESYSIHGEVTSPFDYFLNQFGFSGGFLALAEEAAKAKEILERFTEGIVKIALEQAAHKVDAIKISSPYAGAGFISPRYYREFVLPYERRIARAVRDQGVPVYTHTCGAINDRLEMIAEAGISGIECLDPPPLGNVELAEAKARVGREIFIKGNIDPVHTLLFGTPEKVRQDVRSRIEAGMPGGGFILSTACSIAPYTAKEHIQGLVPLAQEWGRYGA
jgi:uroporphyrinogen-III decarboxylase